MPFTIIPDPIPIFPTDISFGYPGGPEYATDVTILEAGHEQRNAYWEEPRYSWDVGYGVRTIDKVYALLRFFHACKGRAQHFRFKDWLDYKSCNIDQTPSATDQSLGAAEAGQTEFQLLKRYPEAIYETVIEIIKPRGNTIRISENNVEVTDGWTIDERSGIITRSTALNGEVVRWGGEFYRKARFDVDKLNHAFEAWRAGRVEVPVIGLRKDEEP